MSEVIRLLPDHIANQIAAGEVIQRPASVVKELVENAIDAGASKVDIYIKDAGKTLIQVLDNGSGMSEMDARMAFERHATSKVRTAEDLFALHTKGFRGEALASIAAIAHVELKTRMAGQEWGTSICVEGSKVVDQSPVTCAQGASFEVKNLFYNVPARRNFLKSDAVEFKHIEDEFLRIALAHPGIQLALFNNGTNCYQLPEGNLRKRIVDIFGRAYNDKLVPIDETTGIVKIRGFVGKPEFARKSRGEQFLFVNDRFFKDTYYNHAITMAFDNLLVSKTFPSYFVYFEVDPATIDVNVHPTKTEIKFEDDKEIYAILRSAVRQGLGKFNVAPVLDFERETSFDLPWEMRSQPAVEPVIKVNTEYNPFQTSTPTAPAQKSSGQSHAIRSAGFGNHEPKQQDWQQFYALDEIPEVQAVEKPELDLQADWTERKKFIFQGNFMLCPIQSGFLVIQSKRATERVLYDELMQTFMIQPVHSQQMLFPIEISSTASEKMLWEENKKTLERLGFTWETGDETISIIGAPAHLKDEAIAACISSIHEKLSLSQIDKGEIAHEVVSAISTAASLQQAQWNDESANHLLEQLFHCQDHQYSPRGKVILSTITTEELLQKF
jgi:DNA mismatch repair protein MutL